MRFCICLWCCPFIFWPWKTWNPIQWEIPLLCCSPLLSIESFIFHVEIRNRILCTVDRTLINDQMPNSNPVSLEPTLVTMASPSTAPIMLNHLRLSEEICCCSSWKSRPHVCSSYRRRNLLPSGLHLFHILEKNIHKSINIAGNICKPLP